MKRPLLLLNIPNVYGEKRVMGFQPLGLLSLGSYLSKHGEPVVIVDARAEGLTAEQILERVALIEPSMVGICAYTPFIAHAYNLAALLKQRFPDMKVLLGGPHVNATYPESMTDCPYIDFCVYGEGEHSLLELVRALESGVGGYEAIKGLIFQDRGRCIVNSPREEYLDIEELPPLDYGLIDKFSTNNYDSIFGMGRKAMAMVVSRGCPFRCTFCGAQVTHGHKVRYIRVQKAIDEIAEKVARYGIGYVSMKDSTFTVNRKWVAGFCEELLLRKLDLRWGCNARVDCIDEDLLALMVRSGLVYMGFGIESGTERILKVMEKGITIAQVEKAVALVKKYDIFLGAGFMLGNLSETLEEARATVDFARRLRIPLTAFSSTVAYPGTPLYEQAKAVGVLKSEKWYVKRDTKGKFVPVGLPKGNLCCQGYDSEREVRRAYMKYYFTPSCIFRFTWMVFKNPKLIRYAMFYFSKIFRLVLFRQKSQHI